MNMVRHNSEAMQMVMAKRSIAEENSVDNDASDLGPRQVPRAQVALVEQAVHRYESLSGAEFAWREEALARQGAAERPGQE